MPATAAAVEARAVAMAFLVLPLLRPLPTFPTRVGLREFLRWLLLQRPRY